MWTRAFRPAQNIIVITKVLYPNGTQESIFITAQLYYSPDMPVILEKDRIAVPSTMSSFITEYKSCSMSLDYLSSAIICFISLLGFFSSVLKNSGYMVFVVSREIHSKYSGDPSSRNVLSSSSKSSGTFI